MVPAENGAPFEVREGEDCWVPLLEFECIKAWFPTLEQAAEAGARKAEEVSREHDA